MKRSILSLLSLCLFLVAFQSNTAEAQIKEDMLMIVSTDKVDMSKTAEYEKAVKTFNAKHQEHKVKSVGWWGSAMENSTYVYGVPIDDMASLDNAYWKESVEKIGDASLDKLFKDMNQYVTSNEVLIYNLVADLSYMHPETPYNGNDFREVNFYQFKTGTAKEVRALAKAYKDLYTEKKLKGSFQIYQTLYGKSDQWVVLQFAKSEQDLVERRAINEKLMGAKRGELAKKMQALLVSSDTQVGMFRDDLTYFAESEDEPTAGNSGNK